MLSSMAFSTSSRRRTAPCSASPMPSSRATAVSSLPGHLARLVEVAAHEHGLDLAQHGAVLTRMPRERDVTLDRDRGPDRGHEQDRQHE